MNVNLNKRKYKLYTAQQAEVRIRQELKKLDIPGDDKTGAELKRQQKLADKCVAVILKRLKFSDSHTQCYILPDSRWFTFAPKIQGIVDEFSQHGLTIEQYLRSASKQPSLYYRNPETLAPNINGFVEIFKDHGLTVAQHIKNANEQPSLYYQNPQTLAANINGFVEIFKDHGLTVAQHIKNANKKPQLYNQSPETIAGHVRILHDLNRKGLLSKDGPFSNDDFWHEIEKCPRLICLANENLALREVYYHTCEKKPSMAILTYAKGKVMAETAQALLGWRHNPDVTTPLPEGLKQGFNAKDHDFEERAKAHLARALVHADMLPNLRSRMAA